VRTIIVIFFILSCFKSFSQLCGVSVSKGIINPITTQQTTVATGNGQRIYFNFNAKKGCNYIFSTVGLTTVDTEITILRDTTFQIVRYNDDYVSSLQSYINFYCNATGSYLVLITRWNNGSCKVLNKDVSISVYSDCGVVLGDFSGEESSIVQEVSEVIPPLNEDEVIVKLYELDGREIPLDSKGIVIAEYADRTRKIIKIK
jgi:hypothetical protein